MHLIKTVKKISGFRLKHAKPSKGFNKLSEIESTFCKTISALVSRHRVLVRHFLLPAGIDRAAAGGGWAGAAAAAAPAGEDMVPRATVGACQIVDTSWRVPGI